MVAIPLLVIGFILGIVVVIPLLVIALYVAIIYLPSRFIKRKFYEIYFDESRSFEGSGDSSDIDYFFVFDGLLGIWNLNCINLDYNPNSMCLRCILKLL